MVGSMYAAIAGLKTHMSKLNVIGNNVANCNTFGYKSGRTTFKESLYSTVNGSSAGGTEYGGTNAAQIGYGSKLGTIDLLMTPGNYAPTGQPSDCMLTGGGFFMVGAKPGAAGYVPDPNNLTLTRVGNFTFDSDGYLTDAEGRCVYGFAPQGNATTGEIVYVDNTGAEVPKGTDGATIKWDTALRPIRYPVAKPDAAGVTDAGVSLYPTVETDNTLKYPFGAVAGGAAVKVDSASLSVGNNGIITATNQVTGEIMTVGVMAVGNVVNPNGLTKTDGPYYRAGGNSGDVSVGTVSKTVTGNLNNIVTGLPLTGTGEGKIQSGGLELSNTDISNEFAEMITTQRGFQANTKIVTVTDEMLSDLVSMKR